MAKKITTDPSQRIDIYSRSGRDLKKSFSFFNGDGSDFDLTGYDFSFVIRKYQGDESVLNLIVGGGVTISGNEVQILEENISLSRGKYIYEFIATYSGNQETWLNGNLNIHDGVFDSFTEASEITVTPEGSPVNITINSGLSNVQLPDKPLEQTLSYASSISIDWQSRYLGQHLIDINSAINATLSLSNVVRAGNHTVMFEKNVSGDITITLDGAGLSFYGYDNSDYSNTPEITLSGAVGDKFDISFLARTSTDISVVVGKQGN